MLHEDLKSLGLTENEIRVYLALVQLGKVRAADVLKETGLHRHLGYQALDRLVDRRLASKTTQAGVFHFQATDPEHLRDRLREQELAASRAIDELKERLRLSDQEITVYEGEDAIRTFSLKHAAGLERGECIHVLGSGGARFERAMGKEALKTYDETVVKRGGGMRILMYKRQRILSERIQYILANKRSALRVLPFDMQPTANVVFTDHVVGFMIFEHPYSVIEVRNPHLVAAYKQYFQMLWSQDVRVEQGPEAFHDAFYDMVNSLAPGEEYYVLGGNLGREYKRQSKMFDDYHRYRIERGVIANILAQHEAAPDIRERNHRQGDPEDKISHVRSFQTPFLSPMQICLYKNKAFMVLYKDDSQTIIHFDDPQVYEGFKLYFDEIWQRQTETLRGHDGIIALCERVLEEGKDWYLIAATGTIMRTHASYYKEFTRRRVEKGVRLNILANEYTRDGRFAKLPLSAIKFLPKAFASPMVIWIFGNTVAHVLWHEPETIFIINDAKTAEYYRAYYRALEEVSKP